MKIVVEMYFLCQQKALKYGFYELNSKIVKYFAAKLLNILLLKIFPLCDNLCMSVMISLAFSCEYYSSSVCQQTLLRHSFVIISLRIMLW